MALAPNSPRLPSPPPPAEIQVGPQSPPMGPYAGRQAQQQMEQTAIDSNARRRIHPGTRAADMAAGPPLVPLNELDSAFQLQEHLAALHYHHTASNTQPVTREAAAVLAIPPDDTDRTLWLYELCRFLIAQCNSLIVGFLFDSPPCSAATCPEMRASEWQFLCAVHDAPKSCCAIDYSCHTLDWAANVITNPNIFPSRFVIVRDSSGSNGGSNGGAHYAAADAKSLALKNLVNVFRRLHRIFAHAWFQHRGVFWAVEGQTGLYVFFKTVCDVYELLPAENYKLPPEAEGLAGPEVGWEGEAGADDVGRKQHPAQPQYTAIAKNPHRNSNNGANNGDMDAGGGDDGYAPFGRTNTRRHIKSSPSTGSAVTTVPEADEMPDDDADMASIPVIMERDLVEEQRQHRHQPQPHQHHRQLPIRPAAVQPSSTFAARAPQPLEPTPEVEEGADNDAPPPPPDLQQALARHATPSSSSSSTPSHADEPQSTVAHDDDDDSTTMAPQAAAAAAPIPKIELDAASAIATAPSSSPRPPRAEGDAAPDVPPETASGEREEPSSASPAVPARTPSSAPTSSAEPSEGQDEFSDETAEQESASDSPPPPPPPPPPAETDGDGDLTAEPEIVSAEDTEAKGAGGGQGGGDQEKQADLAAAEGGKQGEDKGGKEDKE